jgi:hypothetical protein
MTPLKAQLKVSSSGKSKTECLLTLNKHPKFHLISSAIVTDVTMYLSGNPPSPAQPYPGPRMVAGWWQGDQVASLREHEGDGDEMDLTENDMCLPAGWSLRWR